MSFGPGDANPYAAPATTEVPPRVTALGVRSVLSESLGIVLDQGVTFLIVVTAVWLPLGLMVGYAGGQLESRAWGPWLLALIELTLGAISAAAVTIVCRGAVIRSPVSAATALRGALAIWIPFAWTYLCSVLAIVFGLLLVLPGIYLAVRLWPVEGVVVNEGLRGVAAIGRSMDLTRGNFWGLFRIAFLTMVITTVPSSLVEAISTGIDSWIVHAISGLAQEVMFVFPSICAYVIYERLRIDQALGAPQLEDTLGTDRLN